MMKTLVTGADGLLGSNVVRELLARSHEIRAFVQPSQSQTTLKDLDLEVVYGDLLDIDQVEQATDGCDAVIHCAGSTAVWPARNPTCMRVNVQGTRHVLQACLKTQVNRLVHVSSASTFRYGTKALPGKEGTQTNLQNAPFDYIRSKILGQQLVLDTVQRTHLEAVFVNPTFMLGAYDARPSSGAMILAFLNKKLPGYTAGGRNFVHVKDAATAICNALRLGKSGSCYILGNENLTYKDFFSRMAFLTNRPCLKLQLPPALIKLYGIAGSLFCSITEKPPTLSYPMAKIACAQQFYSAAKARKILNLPDTPIEYAISDAINWFAKNGYLNHPVSIRKLPYYSKPMDQRIGAASKGII